MIVKILLNNVEYDILYLPKYGKADVKFHKPLAIALWKGLTEERQKTLIIINPKNEHHKILNFDKLIECYICNTITRHEYNLVAGKCYSIKKDKFKLFDNQRGGYCCCGAGIEFEFLVKNIDSNKSYIIGSECINWWDCKKDISNIKEITKAMLDKKEITKFCAFCKSSRNCILCKQKHNIKNIFTKWKIYSNMKITNLIDNLKSPVLFGKYKTQTFYKLCQDNSYVNYILNNDFNENIKYKIRSYLKYKHLLNKENYEKRLK
jgi:hypothetical protein